MDLNPFQQRLAFAVIVVALAGLGVYLILPSAMGSRRPPAAGTTPPSQPAPATTPVTTPAALPPAQPSAVPTPAPTGSVNIYQWLPFTQSDLASAAGVVTKFAAYFDTFSYTDSAQAYVGRMSRLVTSQFASTLQADYDTYGVAKQRTQRKEVSSATATINQLRSFGPSSMIFVVTIDQRTNLAGQGSTSQQWSITAVRSGTSWQVSDIQPASAGNS